MKPILRFLLLTLLLCGCSTTKNNFKPDWLSDPSQVVYSVQHEGNARVKVKAKITEAEFAAATKKLNMLPHSADAEFEDHKEALQWKPGPDKHWDPLPALDHTFLCHRLNWWELAKYENGFMFYQLVDLED